MHNLRKLLHHWLCHPELLLSSKASSENLDCLSHVSEEHSAAHMAYYIADSWIDIST